MASSEPNEPRTDRTDWLRVALAVFVGIGAAAGLFALGVQYAHHDGHMDGGSMMRGDRSSQRGSGMGMGMMGSMSVESEREFLVEMIPHHQEAIDSAKVLRSGTEREEMREFADEIIETQQAEVDSMEEWLEKWHDGADPSKDYSPMMRKDLDELEGDELDRAFLQDMMMHHMMAVHMARSLVQQDLAEHDEVEDLARSIDETQRSEIRQMRSWLREWFGDRAGPGGSMPGMRDPMM